MFGTNKTCTPFTYDASYIYKVKKIELHEDCVKMFTEHQFCLTAGQTGSWLLGDWEYCGECTGEEGDPQNEEVEEEAPQVVESSEF